ncbi:MAG: DMT family transporter, partial [Candidatus Hodarchaeota archaeon]
LRLFFGALVGGGTILIFLFTKPNEFQTSINSSLQGTYFIQGSIFAIMILVYLSSIALGTPVGEAAFLIQIHPIITLLLGYLFLKEKINTSKLLALFLAMLGLVILTSPWQWDSFLSSLIGDFLALSNGILYAFYLLMGRWSLKYRAELSSSLSIAWVLLWGLLIGFPIIILLSLFPVQQELTAFSLTILLSPSIILLGILLTLFGSIIPYGLIMLSSSYDIESSKQSILLLGEPISAMILGMLILSEGITFWYIIGGGTLMIAIILILSSTRGREDWEN